MSLPNATFKKTITAAYAWSRLPRRSLGAVRRFSHPGRHLLIVLLIGILASCDRPAPVHTLNGFAQGTTWSVKFWTPDDTDPADLRSQISEELKRLDKALSNYRPDSTIEEFNTTKTLEPISVGAEIVALVEKGMHVSNASRGCYDLTVGPLFKLWGFKGDALHRPDEQALQQTLSTIGISHLTALPPDRLIKLQPNLTVDLSSIGQGYSVSRIAAILAAKGIENYLVEIGGEMLVQGFKPDASPWRIAVERPLPGQRSIQKVLAIGNSTPVAVMASGTYRHFYDEDGTRYSHILDARTGKPVEHKTVSVTVVHEDATLADAWSTALLCLGQAEGVEVANKFGVNALFIVEDGDEFVEFPTVGWGTMTSVKIDEKI